MSGKSLNFDLPKSSKMNINLDLPKVSKMTSLKIYLPSQPSKKQPSKRKP